MYQLVRAIFIFSLLQQAFAMTEKKNPSKTKEEMISPFDGCALEDVSMVVSGNVSVNNYTGVLSHLRNPPLLVDTDAYSLSCVDARGEAEIIGTPAGDIGEFLVALIAYKEHCHGDDSEIPQEKVTEIMAGFIEEHTAETRPFYMHTDDTRLSALLQAMKVDAFPKTMPANANEWFDTIANPTTRYVGCGHLWYMFENAEKYHVTLPLMKSLFTAYFTLYWDPKYQPFMRYHVVLGKFDFAGVAIVSTKITKPKKALRGSLAKSGASCVDRAPLMNPRYRPAGAMADEAKDFVISKGGKVPAERDVFVYHASAVARHREKVTGRHFYDDVCDKKDRKKVTFEKFLETMNEVAGEQLEETLHHLNALPSNVPHYSVEVELMLA